MSVEKQKEMPAMKLTINLDLPALDEFQPFPLPKTCWEVLKDYDFEPLGEFEGVDVAETMKRVEEKMGGMNSSMSMECFQSEKIEKLCFGWTIIMNSIVVVMFSGWPRDGYDFPALSMDMVESVKHVYIGADFVSLTDIVMNDWYREKYLDGFEPIYKQHIDLLDKPLNPMNWFRALASPYAISGRPDISQNRAIVKRTSDCFVAFIQYWLEEVVKKGEPVKDTGHRAYVNKRKAKARDEFRRKDPGGPPLVVSLGKELAWNTIKLIF
jgi:hypothetical protein